MNGGVIRSEIAEVSSGVASLGVKQPRIAEGYAVRADCYNRRKVAIGSYKMQCNLREAELTNSWCTEVAATGVDLGRGRAWPFKLAGINQR